MGVEGTDQTSVNGSGENLNKLPPPNGTTDQVEDSKPDPSVIVSKPTPLFDIDDVLKKMGAVDKITLLSGKDGWHTRDILRFKIPSMRLSDGKWEDIIILLVSNFAIHRTQRRSRHSMYISNFLLILPDTNNKPNL